MSERLNFAKGRGKISTGKYASLTRLVSSNPIFILTVCDIYCKPFLHVKIQIQGDYTMSNRKTTADKIEEAKAKITQYENHMKQLVQKQKAEERKARTKRLCSRAGLLESMLPDTIALTDEQFKSFLEKTTSNDFGRRTLANIAKGSGAATTPKPAGATQRSATATPQGEGNSAGQNG